MSSFVLFLKQNLSKWVLALSVVSLLPDVTKAQIVPDSTLNGENSAILSNQKINNVRGQVILVGGAARGTTLFHSFKEFNVLSNQGVYFANPVNINNILVRVTGNNSSNISGVLGVLGNANLFFLNPNGITFGRTAKLDLKGSFFATTATGFNLSNGTQFSSKEPQSLPLLTILVPIGLTFTGNQGSINVQGGGFHLSSVVPTSRFLTPVGGTSTTGLRLREGSNISLVGGSVNFDGGIITAPGGSIKVGSVSSGQVGIKFSSRGWNLDYSNVQQYQDILLNHISLLDASGSDPGSIYLQGRNIQLLNGSFIFLQNQGSQSGGEVVIKALENLLLNGRESNIDSSTVTYDNSQNASGILTQNFSGQGPNINISAKNLSVKSGGTLTVEDPLSGSSGNIIINASDSVKVVGFSPLNPASAYSDISARSDKSGNAGDISIHTGNLSIVDGAFISSTILGVGNAGIVSVDATRGVSLKGYNPSLLSPSYLSSNTYGAGNASNIFVNTPQLTLSNGGVIASLSLASGSAGNVTINAPNFVNVTGIIPGAMIPSLIIASAGKIDSSSFSNLQQRLGVPSTPSGDSGSVSVSTKELNVDNAAQVAVRNDGSGKAGILTVNARSIFLNNKSAITAASASGQGGNLFLRTQNLQLRHDSAITATANGGSGNGGNITINAATLVALENSPITANAFLGNGGNVQISVQALFRSPDSTITASSRLGIDGTVQINTLGTNPGNALTILPTTLVDVTREIAQGCAGAGGNFGKSEFYITGRGGLPPHPGEPLQAEALIPRRASQESRGENYSTSSNPKHSEPSTLDPLEQAQGWIVNSQGEVELVATPPTTSQTYRSTSATCYAR